MDARDVDQDVIKALDRESYDIISQDLHMCFDVCRCCQEFHRYGMSTETRPLALLAGLFSGSRPIHELQELEGLSYSYSHLLRHPFMGM